jgi:hypothetical protein
VAPRLCGRGIGATPPQLPLQHPGPKIGVGVTGPGAVATLEAVGHLGSARAARWVAKRALAFGAGSDAPGPGVTSRPTEKVGLRFWMRLGVAHKIQKYGTV